MDKLIHPSFQKFKIEKDIKEKLKLYLLILRERQFPPIPGERLTGVLSYRVEDALLEVKERCGKSNTAIIYTGDYILLEELFKKIETKGVVISAPEEKPKVESMIVSEKLGIKGFKASLMMVMSEYIKDEQDKKDLERILNKINEKEKI